MPSPVVGLYERPDVDGLRIARGLEEDRSFIFKFGFFDEIDATEYTIWDGAADTAIYVHPSAATTMTISSSDANDTSAGTGARTVEVFGLDANHLEISETATLNGQTGVTLANQYLRINRGIVRTAGSGLKNAGKLWVGEGTVTAGVPATKYLAISIGENQTLHAVYTVPANKTAYLTDLLLSSSQAVSGLMVARLCVNPGGAEVMQTKDKLTLAGTVIGVNHNPPVPFAEKTDIEVRAQRISGAGDMNLSAGFNLVLIDG